jgi:hypothetical protein
LGAAGPDGRVTGSPVCRSHLGLIAISVFLPAIIELKPHAG